MEFILKVTQDGIIIPKDIPNGEYKLLLIENKSKVEATFYDPSIEEAFSYFDIGNISSKDKQLRGRALRVLRKHDIDYLSELKTMDARDLFGYEVGIHTVAVIVAVCNKFGVKLTDKENKIPVDVIKKWEEYIRFPKK